MSFSYCVRPRVERDHGDILAQAGLTRGLENFDHSVLRMAPAWVDTTLRSRGSSGFGSAHISIALPAREMRLCTRLVHVVKAAAGGEPIDARIFWHVLWTMQGLTYTRGKIGSAVVGQRSNAHRSHCPVVVAPV